MHGVLSTIYMQMLVGSLVERVRGSCLPRSSWGRNSGLQQEYMKVLTTTDVNPRVRVADRVRPDPTAQEWTRMKRMYVRDI